MRKTRQKSKPKKEEKYMSGNGITRHCGGWTVLPTQWFQIMTAQEAIVLSYLMTLGEMEERNGKTRDGWFRCSAKRICNTFEMTPDRHRWVFSQLTKRGFIRRKMAGNPARRWLDVDYDAINEAVEDSKCMRPRSKSTAG